MVSHPENGSDSPIGSDRDRGRDTFYGNAFADPHIIINNICCNSISKHSYSGSHFLKGKQTNVSNSIIFWTKYGS